MKQNIIFLIVIITLLNKQNLCAVLPHDGDLDPIQPPVFTINLQQDPYYRWSEIVPIYKDVLQDFVSKVLDPLDISNKTYAEMGLYFSQVYKYQEFIQEIKGIAAAAEIKWQKLLIANFFYEASTFPMCSSILALDKYNNILHGRNIDFPFFEYLSKMTAQVHVYDGDKYLGIWDQFIGAAIVLTAYNEGKFSISVDTRKYRGDMRQVLDNIVINQYVPSSLLTKFVLSSDYTYEQAYQTLLETNVTSSIYYILGGLHEGAVIEKEDVGYKGVQHLNSETSNWFIVQTNYDIHQDPLSDDRKTPAQIRLLDLGQQNLDAKTFLNVMTKYPTLNLYTIYSSILSAQYNTNEIDLWYGNVYDFYYNMENFDELRNVQTGDSEYIKTLIETQQNIKKLIDIIQNENYFGKILQQNGYNIKDLEQYQ